LKLFLGTSRLRNETIVLRNTRVQVKGVGHDCPTNTNAAPLP
jgi:hypothetical protein